MIHNDYLVCVMFYCNFEGEEIRFKVIEECFIDSLQHLLPPIHPWIQLRIKKGVSYTSKLSVTCFYFPVCNHFVLFIFIYRHLLKNQDWVCWLGGWGRE